MLSLALLIIQWCNTTQPDIPIILFQISINESGRRYFWVHQCGDRALLESPCRVGNIRCTIYMCDQTRHIHMCTLVYMSVTFSDLGGQPYLEISVQSETPNGMLVMIWPPQLPPIMNESLKMWLNDSSSSLSIILLWCSE